MKATFDTAGFLRANFHDTNGLLAFLRGHGLTDVPAYDSVYKWFYRGVIPEQWLATIVTLLEADKTDKGPMAPHVKIG